MEPESVERPWWLAAIVIGLGILCIWGSSSLPAASRYAGIGPGAFATIIGAALILLGILLGIQILRGATFETQQTENASADLPANWKAFALALVAAALPILTLERLGLPLTAMMSFALVARSFGSRRLGMDILTGAILGSLAWLLFDRLGLQLGAFLPLAGF